MKSIDAEPAKFEAKIPFSLTWLLGSIGAINSYNTRFSIGITPLGVNCTIALIRKPKKKYILLVAV